MKKAKHNIKNFKCPWPSCLDKPYFQANQDYSPGAGRHGGSNQIRCHNCNNFIETWKKEKTDNKFTLSPWFLV